MATSTQSLLTYEQFLDQYDGEFAEWEAGVVVPMSPVTFAHQDISIFLTRLLAEFVEENDSGLVLNAPFQMRLHETDRGREPDVMVVLRRNVARIRETFLDGPADLVIEIVSPESVERDRRVKFTEYEREGVSEYWIVDPVAQNAEFFWRNAEGRYVAVAPDSEDIYRSAILPGFWLHVAWLWQRPLPPLRQVIREWEQNAP